MREWLTLPERRMRQQPLPRIEERRRDLDNPLTRLWDSLCVAFSAVLGVLGSSVFWHGAQEFWMTAMGIITITTSAAIGVIHLRRLLRAELPRQPPQTDHRES